MEQEYLMEEEYKPKQVIKMPIWVTTIMTIIFVIVVLIILYLQFVRYGLVAKSISYGDTATSAMLLSPEITTGLARLF